MARPWSALRARAGVPLDRHVPERRIPDARTGAGEFRSVDAGRDQARRGQQPVAWSAVARLGVLERARGEGSALTDRRMVLDRLDCYSIFALPRADRAATFLPMPRRKAPGASMTADQQATQ